MIQVTYTRVASIAVVFVMLAVSFNTMCVSAPPETAQDWIIVGNERYEDGDFYQGTNIVVESGGSLALVDCSVTLYDHSDHAIDFSVKAGGKLEISNCTIVGELSTYYGNTRWTFRIYGSALLNSSKLTGLGGRGPIGGVQVYSNDVAIVSTEIEDSSSSAVFVDKASPYLYGNIVRNSVYGYYFNGSVTTQTLTTFSDGNATQTRQFVGPGSSANITLTLPKRAQLSQAEMSITGSYLQPSTSSDSPWANGLVRANGIDEGYWYKNWDPAGYIWGIFAADSTNGIRVVCDGYGSRLLVPIYSRLPGVGGDLLSPTDVTSNGDYMYVIDGTHVDMFRTLAGSIYWFDTLTGFIKAPKGTDYYNGILCIADRTYKLVIYGREAGPITTELSLAISDVSVCSSGIYVLDGTHIDVFTLDGVWRYKITQGLGRPNRIDVRDKIYVSDETYGLVVLNLDGTLVYRGAPGLSTPKGVAASSFNKVYVQDSGNHIDIFDCGYPASPSLDIGCDGDVDWSVSGGFESTIKMNSSNSRILDELGSFTQADGSGDVEIPMSISSGSTGVTTLSGLRIDYSVQPVFYSNLAQNNEYGVVFNNTSAVYCNRTLSLNNGVGFCFWNSSPTVRDSTVLFSGTYDLAFESGSHPNLVRTNYSKQSVSITGSPDSDNDGLSDAAETYVYGTDPLLNDTDGDGFSDGWEILHGGNPLGYGSDGVDSDSDMLGDYYEDVIGTNRHNADSDGDGLTDGFEYYVLKSNPLSADSDSDGLADMVEFRAGTNLTSADSDSDGVRDGDEISWSIDTDGDGLINANDNDSDGDGLGDGLEAQIGTSMVLADTDSDSVTDYAENEFWERATFVGPAVFTDTFDSGADGWTKVGDGGFVEIYPWFGDPADPCLELGRTQLTGNVSAWHNFTPQYNHFVAEMAVIATAPWSGSKVDIVFAADDGAWSFNLTRVFSNLYAFPSGKSVGPMWNYAWDNVWYELKINVDLFNGTYDVTLTRGGSSAVCKGAAMNHPTNNPTGINRLGFVLRDSSDSLIWIDDIRIYQGISAVDSDGDGLANIVDPDSDNDGLLDGQEMRLWGDLDSDGDGLVNVLDNDSDNDGIPDGVEVNTYSTSPVLADTDNDGLTDSQEISVYGTDPVDNDTDGDGLKDGDEVAFWLGMGLDPVVADTDGDGIRNVVDYDSDNDGFPDGWEVQNGLNPAAGQIPPTAPIGLVVTGQAGMIFIAWSPPSSIGGSDLIRYTVYRSISDGHAWGPMVCIAQVGPDVLSCDDFDVVNWTMYKYAVTANNSFGESPFSNEGWTTPLSVPDAPITLGASAFLGAVNFAWYVYPHRDGGSEVTAWRIYRGTAPGEETLLYEGFGGKGRYWDSNVANGTTYFYQVSLVNAVGEGARSEEAYATPYGPPASPRNLACTPGNGQITLSWEAPAGLDSNITCYEIYRGDYSLNESFLTNVSSGELRYTDANLGRNQTYFYRVRAVNEYGPGLFSYEANATTWTIPESPQNLTATPGVRQIGLCWSEPVSGGPPILSYIIYRGNVSGGETYFREIKPVNAEWQDIFLPNGVTYYYRISAVNTLGESPQSNEAFSTTFDVPSAPRALVAVSGKQAVSLTWLEPLSSGGTEVLHYTIYRRTETSSYLCLGTTLDGHQFTYVDGGLPNGQLYYYYVVANNSVGGSAQSNIASATTPNVPGAPSNLVATATGTTINLVWQTPPDGGSPITGYKIYRGTLPGSIPYLTTVVGVTQFSDQSLAKGQIYYYKIIAANDVGDSLPSNVVNATTWKNPSTVVNPQCTPSSTQIVLTWTKPLDNGGATDLQLSYKIYRSTSPGAEVQIATVTGTTSFTDTGRTNGQVYYYKISASNLAGDSALSYEISAKPGTAPTIPSAPLYLTAAGGGASTITLTWNVPGSNGGSPITAYKIYRSTIKGKEAYFKTATSWSIDPLTGKLKWSDYPVTGTKTYYYKISAVNGVGEGPLSNEASSLPGTSALSTYLSAASNNAESSSSILLVNPTYSTVMVGASSSATTLSMTQSLADRYYYDDNDSDGLVNGMEDFYGTSPFKPDSDGDGLSDSLEVAFWFSIGSSPTADGDNDGLVNVLDPDSAGDGMLDGQRKKFLEDLDAKNPGQPYAPGEDFDADGVVNMLEKDWDNDGVLNGKEMLAIPAGCSIDQLLVFEQDDYSSTWNQQAVMISIPLTSDGQIVPLHGGSLTVTGVESGGGLFGDRRTFDVPVSWINDIDAGDLDGDGRVDVVVSSGQSSIIGVLYNLGNAMFDNSTTVNVGGSAYGVCVGKFDGDGRADIAVSRSGTSTVAILFSNGRGAFYGPKYVSVRAGLQVLDVAAFGNQIWVTYTSSTWVTRIVASSRDSFTTTDFNVGHEARYVFPADLNGQGKVGLFLACPSQLGWELYIPGSIYAPFWYYWTSDYRVQALAPGDHDNDGQVDVIVMPSDNQACGINLALDPGYNYVTGWSNPTYLGNAARQYDVASSDIDGDGVPDIIFPVGASSIGRLLCAPFIDEGSGLNTTIVYDYRW
ncbi:MAG: fibronectin type III domain-containing protein [Thermoplasmata archaeon]|nr:fibronectin type III domain-containing protein [Thermoplasmata archaeon]